MGQPITICAPSWDISESYGRIARETRSFLLKQGYYVNTLGNKPPNRSFIPTFNNLLLGYPVNFSNYGRITDFGRRTAITMFESSKLPPYWADNLNLCDSVVVPCRWNVEVFKNAGVTVPVHMIPLGVSQVFHYHRRRKRKVFRFLTIGDRGQRKGFIEAIISFVRAFGKRDDVELLIKSRSLKSDSPLLNLANANIKIINEDYTDEQMRVLYWRCDCMIFPAHGEGFALPPREFAASGGIALATNFGGMADEIDQWGIPIPYTLVDAWPFHEKFQGLGQWPDADVDALAAKMTEIHDLKQTQRVEMGYNFSQRALALYRWDDFGQKVFEIVAEPEPLGV